MGMDANTPADAVVDHVHIGRGVPRCTFDSSVMDRALLLHDFVCEFGIYLANTFSCVEDQLHYTRTN